MVERNKLGQFKKGTHWRPHKPFWDRNWLIAEYEKKSSGDIAREFGTTDAAILFWLRKHGIKRRNVSEARSKKHWGLLGEKNGMYGRIGKRNPRWNGGYSPERQTMYARSVWKELAKKILARDSYHCKRCGVPNKSGNKLIVHHIRQWSKYPQYRFEESNLVTICEKCHLEIHRKKIGGWLIS